MIIRNYFSFLFESIITASDDFVKILNLMSEDPVAQEVLKLIGPDVKTNYNFIKLADEPGKLAFLPDSQATRKLSSGATPEELFAAAANPTSIGRLVKSLLNANKIDVTEVQLDKFGNKFRSLSALRDNEDKSIRIVEGEEIKFWYLEDNYEKKPHTTLNYSCMRHFECQEYFDIYSSNPDVVKMVIKTNASNKLVARALLWETDQGLYLDRVYHIKDEYHNLLHDWASIKYGKILRFPYNKKMTVQLKPHKIYDHFPYMDSFSYYYREEDSIVSKAKLFNFMPEASEDTKYDRLWYTQNTDGTGHRQDMVWSEYEGDHVLRATAVWSEYYDSYLSSDNAFWSDYYTDYLPTDRAVWSDGLSSYIDSFRGHEVNINMSGLKDWYPNGLYKRFFKEETSGEFYLNRLKENFFEQDGKFFNLDKSRFVKILTRKEDIEMMNEIFGDRGDICTQLDAKIWKLKVSEENDIITNEKYFDRHVNMVKEKVIKRLESLDSNKRLIREKIEEIEEIDKYLLEHSKFYKMMNEFGGVEKIKERWQKELTKDKYKKAIGHYLIDFKEEGEYEELKSWFDKYTDESFEEIKKIEDIDIETMIEKLNYTLRSAVLKFFNKRLLEDLAELNLLDYRFIEVVETLWQVRWP